MLQGEATKLFHSSFPGICQCLPPPFSVTEITSDPRFVVAVALRFSELGTSPCSCYYINTWSLVIWLFSEPKA